ncbi:MAG: hypothetical protein C0392_05545 [Syntrophus sp. (in: bacteria)]|nr:hypothetical protein [Syntrophus sp. (in: bacteria)]
MLLLWCYGTAMGITVPGNRMRDGMKIEYIPLRQGRFSRYSTLVFLSSLLILSMVITPTLKEPFSLCIFKNLFGIPCGGCGMTRAFFFLGHGNIAQAIMLNPCSPVVFVLAIMFWINCMASFITRKIVRIHLTVQGRIFAYALSAVMMIMVWCYNLLLNPYV